MRSLARAFLAPAVLAAALVTPVAGAEPATIATLRVADGSDLLAHWAATPLGRTWTDPALEPLRKAWAEAERTAAESTGATPSAWLAASTATQGVIAVPTTGVIPAFRLSTDLGPLATQVTAALATKAADGTGTVSAVTVTGADEAFRDRDQHVTLARLATTLVAFGGGLDPMPGTPAKTTADVRAVVHLAPLMGWLEGLEVPNPEAKRVIDQMVQDWKAYPSQEASYQLRLVPEGALEEIRVRGAIAPGMLAVDRDLVARLAGTTTAAVAIGFDAQAVWAQQRRNALAQWAPLVGRDPQDPDAVEAEINRVLSTMGLPVTIADLAQTKGTVVLALSPGMPVPGLTIWLPRSPGIDRLVEVGATKAAATLPAEGASTALLVPGLPIPLTIARTATHWSITTDAQQAEAFLGNLPGTWGASPAWRLALSKAPAQAHVIGASDTPALLRQVAAAVGMVMGMRKGGDPQVTQAVLAGLNRLAREASTGYIVAGPVDGGYVQEMRSVTGLVPAITLSAGVLLPAVQMVKKAKPAGVPPKPGTPTF